MHRYWFPIVVFVLTHSPALGEEYPQKSGSDPVSKIAEVIDGQTVVLDRPLNRASQVRLAGIQAPLPSAGPTDLHSWPFAEEARATLGELTLDKSVAVNLIMPDTDRHGRLRAQIYRHDGLWIQGEMLKRGMARVLTFVDDRALAAEMLAIEREARANGVGIWGDPFYGVRSPEETGKYLNSIQLVEGRVVKASRVGNRVYLNFGPDWRTDFTVSVATKALRSFAAAKLDLLGLTGKRVRVRGWVSKFNGPMIDADHPEQIEVLDDGVSGTGA